MPRAAIYARFSTDLQSERSIEDQIALCRSYAEREAMTIVATFDDKARSGASIIGRDGLMRLMDQSREGTFDIVIVEALDRLSRDMEDLAGIHKRLTFRGVEIRAVHDGTANTVMVGLRGLVGQLYREDNAQKVRRGMAGVLRDGRSPGGKAYGYRPVAGERGRLEIVPAEAEIVRRIFAAYAAGEAPRAIAAALNREGVPPPRGRWWRASVIYGNRPRGYGLIFNPIYGGRLLWNRTRMVKDPDTGRRVSRINPKSEWHTADVPELRIVAPDLIAAAERVSVDRSHISAPHLHRKPKHLLSGLLKCAACGAGMSVKDRKDRKIRIICTQAKEAGNCDGHAYRLDRVEQLVVDGLKERLADKEALELYVRTYNAERQRLSADLRRSRGDIERRIAGLDRERLRLVDQYAKGFIEEGEVERRVPSLLAEKAQLQSEVATLADPPKVIALHPMALRHYRAAVDQIGPRPWPRQLRMR